MNVETRHKPGSVSSRRKPLREMTRSKKPIQFKSILVPIDFSETSIKALDYAITLAVQFGSKISLVHVLDFPTVFNSTRPIYGTWDAEAKASATQRLTDLIAEKKTDQLIPVASTVIYGRAFKSICDTARKQKADLIVIGTHGFTGLKRVLLGSTAERVVRHAHCSVLTIHSKQEGKAIFAGKRRKVLVPTDFSEPAQEALGFAAEIARQFEAQLQLLYVVPIHYETGEYGAVDFAMLAVEQKNIGKKQLAKIRESLAAKKIPSKTQIRHGRPATEIVEAAEELDAALIVIATQGVTGWRRAVLGSTTEEVIRHSTCPVWVVRGK